MSCRWSVIFLTIVAANSSIVTVQSQPTATQPSASEIRLPGTLIADQAVELYAKVSGYVGERRVDIGSRVRKGDLLIKIEVPELADELHSAEAQVAANRAKIRALAAKVQQAEAAIDTARAEVRRAAADQELREITASRKSELRQGNAISQQEYDESAGQLHVSTAAVKIAEARIVAEEAQKASAEADVKMAEADGAVAEANVARIKTLIAYESITAPFDGVITERNVDVGAFVRSAAMGATTPLLSIAAVERVRLVVDVPEYDAPRIRPGMPAEVVIQALEDRPIRASVSRAAGALRAATRTMRMEIDLDNRDGRLAPGMYARVAFKPQTGHSP